MTAGVCIFHVCGSIVLHRWTRDSAPTGQWNRNMQGPEHYLGETLDAKYRLEKLLGSGGMGAVYLATHLGTERYVALKLISPQFMRNREFVERFKREARAA